jgi:hypothetical protein
MKIQYRPLIPRNLTKKPKPKTNQLNYIVNTTLQVPTSSGRINLLGRI